MNISQSIQNWYTANKRDLPWRETHDPFQIWLSEVILQQTRVEQGLAYYIKFIERFKSISDLAKADEDEVLKMWQGLGYYSRARNLHAAAKELHTTTGGVFPNEHKEILKLKGVGPYTAAAIASFAFKLPYAAVDGNVYRVIARIFNEKTPINSSKGSRVFQELADTLLDRKNPDIHNQAMMELGARICTPSNPDCPNCPIKYQCLAFENQSQTKLPVKEKKTKIRNRYFTYFLVMDEENIALEQRIEKDIWHKLYQPILLETKKPVTVETALAIYPEFKKNSVIAYKKEKLSHKLSHQHIHAQSICIRLPKKDQAPNHPMIPIKKLKEYPVPKLVERIFAHWNLI